MTITVTLIIYFDDGLIVADNFYISDILNSSADFLAGLQKECKFRLLL